MAWFNVQSNALAAALALGLAAAFCAADAAAERLQDAVRTVLRKHPEVLAAAATARGAIDAYDQAAAGRFPVVDLRVAGGKEESDNVGLRAAGIDSRTLNRQEGSLTLRQNVYDGFQVRNEMDNRNYRVESARARLSDTAEIIGLRVSEAYLDALRDQGLVRLAEDNVLRHEEVLEKTTLRFKSGVGQRADAEQAAARVALARSNLVSARGAAEDSAARYFRLVGRNPVGLTDPEVPTQHLPQSLGAAKTEAENSSYGVKSARAELSAAQAAVRSVKADLLPRVDVELTANRNRDVDGVMGANNDNLAMLVLRYNLFRGGADSARTRETMSRETIALETLNNSLQSTEESVARTWAGRTAARDRLPSLDAHARASAQVLQAYRDQFELGRRSLLDLVNAENELFQARSALLTGQSAARLADIRLLVAVGAFVRSLGLAEEVMQLDPGPAGK